MLKICLVLAVVAATASGQCDSGWTPFGHSCYILFPESQSFDTHRVTCENFGGWLVSISSDAESNFVNELQQGECSFGPCRAYIGLARNSAGQFTNWLDGTPFGGSVFSSWNTDEPNNNGGENCVEVASANGKWNDISCSNNRLAICEKPQFACDSGWSPFAYSCYRLITSLQNFDIHRQNCKANDGWLVSITSDQENNFVNRLQQAGCSSGTCDAFIGLERIAGSFAFWKDGTPFGGTAYSNWNTNEPNNVDDGESCSESIRGTGKWNDISCDISRLAVCEKPLPSICGEGWSQFGDCCYTLLATEQDFVVQRSYCQNRGGKLVSISSSVENDFVQALLHSIYPAYLGLLRDSAGQFASWLDGQPFGGSLFSNWNPDEPNNSANNEGCAELIRSTGKWNDVSCDVPRRAVCERCLSPTTTSTTTTTTPTTTPITTTASTTTTTPTTTTPSTTTPTTTTTTIKPTTSTSITVGVFDCRTVRTNVNCGAANGLAACDAQCRLFKYGRGICYSFGYG